MYVYYKFNNNFRFITCMYITSLTIILDLFTCMYITSSTIILDLFTCMYITSLTIILDLLHVCILQVQQ